MDDQGHITVQAGTIESASSTQLEEEAEEAPDISKFIEVKYKGKKVSVDAYLEKKMSEFNLDEDSKVTMRKAFKDKRSLECIPPKGTWDDGNYTPQERMEFVQRYINTSIRIGAGGFARDNNKDLAFKVITSIENEFKDTKLLVSKKLSKEQIAAAAAVAAVITQSTEGTIDATKGKPFQFVRDLVSKTPNARIREMAMPMIAPMLIEAPQYPIGNVTDVKVKIAKKDVVLNTYEETPQGFDRTDPDRKYIVHFCGNGEFAAQRMEREKENAKNFGCGIITFDYPGIGIASDVKATKTQHLVRAGIAQVEKLIKYGVKPENIVLDGYSLGGAVATLTAAHFHKQGIKVHLINEKYFSKLGRAAAHLVVLNGGSPFYARLAKIAIKISGLEMDVVKAYNSIPKEYKTCLFGDKDSIIPYKISMAKAVGIPKDDSRRCIQDCEHTDNLATKYNSEGRNGADVKAEFVQKAFNPDLREKVAKEPGVLDQVKRKIVRKIIGTKDPEKQKHHEKLATERVEKKLEIHEDKADKLDKAEAKTKSKRPEGVTRLDLIELEKERVRDANEPAPPSARGDAATKTVIPEIVVTPPTTRDAGPEAVVPAERTKLRGKEFVVLREKQEKGEGATLKTENVRKDHKKP